MHITVVQWLLLESWSSFDPEGMEVSLGATVQLIERVMMILPSKPNNLNRPHIDVSATFVRLANSPIYGWKDDPITALRNCFSNGEIFLNLNVPVSWNGGILDHETLGMRWYRSAISFVEDTSTFKLERCTH